MTSATPITVLQWLGLNADKRHRIRFTVSVVVTAVFLLSIAVYGFPYWCLSLQERVRSPLHEMLKPSGRIGLKLGILGLACFGVLFLYPIRKRWKWLGKIGKTKHWLDFHVLCGITAPILITFHSSFKMNGVAGMAYWIMMAVALSGFIGRYLYAQIPRKVNASELTLKELETLACESLDQFERQQILSREEVLPLTQLPDRDVIENMSLVAVFVQMMLADMRRPFQMSSLRRKFLVPGELISTLGGCGGSRGCSPRSHSSSGAIRCFICGM
jgi:hypothetical protein